MTVLDQPGVMADIAAVLRNHAASMESVLQRGRSPGEAVSLIMTMHDTVEASMRDAVDEIAALDSCQETPCLIRIEHFS